jgi:DNA-directed RNA polymerase
MIIKQKYMDSADVVVIPSGFTFKLSKHKDNVVVDAGKMARAASPNFIHSLDAAHLRAVIRECDHELVAIHDSVGSHPATFAATARVIREEFVKVHQSDPMKTFTKWNGDIALKLTGDYDVTEVLASKYFFS